MSRGLRAATVESRVFERGYLDENLVDSLPKVRGKVPRQHPIGEAQLQAAFDAAPLVVKAMMVCLS